uniref:3-keto-disaccharide hydrolase n=1 Tax=Pedobacter sp. TaxID=1411316 RepID=UPI003D7FE9B1
MKIKTAILTTSLLLTGIGLAHAQQDAKHEDTEFYTPVPKVVMPGTTYSNAPSDAIVLFDGKNLNQWVMTDDRTQPAKWKVDKGVFTVDKKTGNIETKQAFNNYQLHLEWLIPSYITGEGQARGNSGLFLASIG